MRQHYLGRVRNTYGTVQADVDVSIYLAGTVNAATVYTVATGGVAITVAPQIQSDSDGLIDFYLDESYGSSQLFDIKVGDKTYENISVTLGLGDVFSNPLPGQYQITGIRLDADKKIVITYDGTPKL